MKRARTLGALLLAAILCSSQAARAQSSIDLHAYWDQRCKQCHDDAAVFARRTLSVESGRLLGRHHRDTIESFLRQHYLADDLVVPVMTMLAAQIQTTPRFKTACGGCHGSAAEFARQSLTLQDGTLVARRRARPVTTVLQSHGGLGPEESAAMVATLTRVHGEVAAPR